MNVLHLFAGAGGGIIADMMLGHNIVGAVEINKYCRQVLKARQADGSLPEFPIFEDVCNFKGDEIEKAVDCISGGFPCQDISIAGKGDGLQTLETGQYNQKKFTGIKSDCCNVFNSSESWMQWWHSEPGLGRVANGVAHRVDRLKAIRNGQVPIVAAIAFTILLERFNNNENKMDLKKEYIETHLPNAANINLGFQPRVKLDKDRIEQYLDVLIDNHGWVFPPIELVQGMINDNPEVILTDGYHRYLAACQYGTDNLDSIPVRIYNTPEGISTEQFATLKAVGANAIHGLNRTEADIKKAVGMALAVLGRNSSARSIADAVKISPTTASKYIKEALGVDVPKTIKGKDGKEYERQERATTTKSTPKRTIDFNSEYTDPDYDDDPAADDIDNLIQGANNENCHDSRIVERETEVDKDSPVRRYEVMVYLNYHEIQMLDDWLKSKNFETLQGYIVSELHTDESKRKQWMTKKNKNRAGGYAPGAGRN